MLGENTVLTISVNQTKTASTYVGNGASLFIDGGGTNTRLTGSLTVNGGILTTTGDSFGYSGTTLNSLLLENGATWTIGNGTGHNTLLNSNIILNNSSILVNTNREGIFTFSRAITGFPRRATRWACP